MKRYGPVIFLMVTTFAGVAAGQAMVGYGLGAARAVTTAAPARSIGKSLDKAWESAGKTLKQAPSTARAEARTKAAPAVNYEDPGKIEAGLTYADLIRRFGPPSMQITGEDGARTMTYLGKGAHAELVVKDGKVGSVDIESTRQAAALPR